MSTTNWILYCALAAPLGALAVALYARREPGGRGRFLPAALRGAALALGILLAFDPWLPGLAGGGRGGPLVLLDDSRSMLLPGGEGAPTRWDAARAAARALDADRLTLLSGVAVSRDAVEQLEPRASESRMVPAVRAALEGGTRELVLISDGGITDLDEAARVIAEAGARVRVLDVGGPEPRNAAVSAVDAPRSARAGDTVRVRVEVAALGMTGDSLVIVLEREGDRAVSMPLPAPGNGRTATIEVPIALPAGQGAARLAFVARVLRLADAGRPVPLADHFAEDDARPFFIDVEERPRGIVLLSLRPDWEPRFLMPVLERSSGLPVRGYLRTPAGAYLSIGRGAGAARRVAEAEVQRDVVGASVAVLHGVGAGGPAWLRDALGHDRVLVFPAAASGPGPLSQPLAAAAAGAAEAGDWYVDARPPASPVAALLATVGLAELPPLTSLRPAATPAGAWAPLVARRDRRGAAQPVAIAGGGGTRRWVVAAGSGYWRWALRGGEAARAYGLFWSSMLGWLTEDLGAEAGDAIRPDPRVVEHGDAIAWRVGGEADTLRLRLTGASGVVLDTAVAIGADRTARTAARAPGGVAWEATAGDVQAAGELAVAAWSPEMVRPARDLSVLSARGATLTAGAGGQRRLHTRAWPWILLLGLLCAEWVLRRRLGLR